MKIVKETVKTGENEKVMILAEEKVMTKEEIREQVRDTINAVDYTRVVLEATGYMEDKRWNQFMDFTRELKKVYKEIKEDIMKESEV